MKLDGRKVQLEVEWYGGNGYFELNGVGRHLASLNKLEAGLGWSACTYRPDRAKILKTLPEAVAWIERQLGARA